MNGIFIGSIRRYIEAVESSGIVVSFAVLFGSQVHGAAGKSSDIIEIARRQEKPIRAA
ncbi:MAG: hypothetical protein ACLFTT_13885 [Candidatus Hydrogenedentota bacterium]